MLISLPPTAGRTFTMVRATMLVFALILAGGCASTRVTDPTRTATEQFLLSKAAAEAVEQLSFESLRGRRVFVDTQYFAAAEAAFVLGELRARLLLSGVQLVPQASLAQVVLEVRSGGVGIDRNDFLVGLPAVILADDEAPVGGAVPLATPELAAVKNLEQRGIASVAYVAYWAETGEIVASSGPYIGRTLRDDWWFFGVGPRTVGDIPTAVRGNPLDPAEVPPPPAAPEESAPADQPPPGTPPPPPPPPGRPYDPNLKKPANRR